MGEASRQLEQVQTLIERLQGGDATARDELIRHTAERLHRLTRKMLKGFPRLKRWELTDDVFQGALLRVWSALGEVTPKSAAHFYALASLQIRRELIDLARRYYGPEGIGAKHDSNVQAEEAASIAPADKAVSTLDPSKLAVWTEFHQRVDDLPEQEREAFDLLWYQELTLTEAAALLGISLATLKRRWLAARRQLYEALKGDLPGT